MMAIARTSLLLDLPPRDLEAEDPVSALKLENLKTR